MAVALATLPLKSLVAGEGDTGSACTGTALVVGLIGATLTVGLPAAFAAGFAAGLAAFIVGAADFFTTAGLAADFFATTFCTAGCFAATFFVTIFLATAFFATGLFAGGFFAALLPAAGFFTAAAAFFGCSLAADLPAAGLVCACFAGAALAETFFTGLATTFGLADFAAEVFFTATFDLLVFTSFPLAAVLPFCPLAAVALRVVFAISLHRCLAVAAGCYSPIVLHQQARFWNTRTTSCHMLFRQRNPS